LLNSKQNADSSYTEWAKRVPYTDFAVSDTFSKNDVSPKTLQYCALGLGLE